MPRCVRTKPKSRPDAARRQLARRAPSRIAWMRSRMPPSSSSHIARSAGVASTVRDDLAAVRRRVRVVGADRRASAATARARPRPCRVGDDRQRADALAVQRERLRERGRRRTAGPASRRTCAPRRRLRRCRRRSPGRPCRGTARGRAPCTTLDDLRPTAPAVRSTPVGLWQHACSTTIVPAGVAVERRAACRRSRRRRVAAS